MLLSAFQPEVTRKVNHLFAGCGKRRHKGVCLSMGKGKKIDVALGPAFIGKVGHWATCCGVQIVCPFAGLRKGIQMLQLHALMALQKACQLCARIAGCSDDGNSRSCAVHWFGCGHCF